MEPKLIISFSRNPLTVKGVLVSADTDKEEKELLSIFQEKFSNSYQGDFTLELQGEETRESTSNLNRGQLQC